MGKTSGHRYYHTQEAVIPVIWGSRRYIVDSMEKVVRVSYSNKLPVHQVVLIEGRPMLRQESIIHVQ